MHHARYRKPLCGQLETTDPGVPMSLTTALKRLPPVAEHAFPEQPEAIEISGHSVVVEVPLYNGSEPRAGLRHGIMHAHP
jgi:hypothetical protein